MLPQSYEMPTAALLVLGGLVATFAGYRLFKAVLGIYGFVLGAFIASSTVGVTNTTGMVVAALLGGIAGALVLVFAYFVGIALVGAGLGALVAHLLWTSAGRADPPAAAVIVLAILGAVGAMMLQRYVIVVATAFGGAWTVLVGAVALGREPTPAGARLGDVWIFYPMTLAPGSRWLPIAWILLGLLGTAVQLRVTGKKR